MLLTSVFGPYGQDDEYGSRQMNPMELYHNQVTRTQGAFSLRMFHRSWGIMLIQANIEAPCTLLDFPTLDRFVEELRTQQYDVIGITSILPNLVKVEKMCELIRQHQPGAMIVIGGHIANMPGLGRPRRRRSRGQGGRRGLVPPLPGRRTGPPHPPPGGGLRHWHAQHGRRGAGPAGRRGGHAHPLGRLPVGLQLLLHLRHVRRQRQVGQLLPDRRRTLRRHVPTGARHEGLLLLRHGRELPSLSKAGPPPPGADARSTTRAWALYVFSSANVIRSYSIEQLVGLGISWVWMGIEGCNSQYSKLQGIDTFALVRDLQSHGIRVLGSTIIGLENHTPENIGEAIEHAARHDTDFHQFMLYTPIPGTPLHAELSAQGRMKDPGSYHPGDIHGQLIFNYRHPHIPEGQEGEYDAPRLHPRLPAQRSQHDADRAAPRWPAGSAIRTTPTSASGGVTPLRPASWPLPFQPLSPARVRYYRNNPQMRAKLSAILADLHREFGWKSRLFSAVGGWYVLWKIRREEKRLASGWTYEPPTYYEKNEACDELAARVPLPLRHSAPVGTSGDAPPPTRRAIATMALP